MVAMAAMNRTLIDTALTMHLTQIRERLDQAAGIAKAAEACASAKNIPKAIEIALDIEQLVYEVTTLLNAASLMHRLCRNASSDG
jgi:hypothetical protein